MKKIIQLISLRHNLDTSLPWFFWLFPIAFAIHNLEETIWFPPFSKSAGKFHKPVNTFEFAFAITVLTLASFLITVLFYYSGKQSLLCNLFFAFNFAMLLNIIFPHLAATIALKKYCPGLLTGIFLLFPVTIYILTFGYKHEYFLLPEFFYVTAPFIIIMLGSIPLLFKTGIWLQKLIHR